MRVLLHRPGLLHRFGRPVPQAVGMVAELRRLVEGLRRRPRVGSRDAEVGLAALDLRPDLGESTAEDGAPGGREEGPFDGLARLRSSLDEFASDDLLFTASHAVLAAATTAGVTGHRIGSEIGHDRVLDFSEVPRRVEEALRLPTARPMSGAARTGGLLALPVASRREARRQALAAIRQDPRADWVELPGYLLLYTEDPDLEDTMAERPRVERLSYAVNRGEMVFEASPEAGAGAGRPAAEGAGAEGELFRAAGFRLRQKTAVEDEVASRRAPPLWPWHAVRRTLPPPPGSATEAGPVAGARAEARQDGGEEITSAFHDQVERWERRLGPLPPSPTALRLYDTVSRLTGPEAATDLWPGDAALTPDVRFTAPPLLSWQTPHGDPQHDAILVIRHRLPAAVASDGDSAAPFRRALSAALAIGGFLRRQPGAPAALHVLHLADVESAAASDSRPSPDPPPDPTAVFLLTDERRRLRREVDVEPRYLKPAALPTFLSTLLS